MKLRNILYLILIMTSKPVFSQDTIIPLWPGAIPNRIETDEKEIHEQDDILRISYVQSPEIAVYLPSKANSTGKGVLIFPGGGYHILAYDWEGTDIAKWLNSNGIAAFVVKYRLPVSKSLVHPSEVPLIDAQRALRLVRGMHEKWQVDEHGIGIMGFSAGGHLASTLGTQFDRPVYQGVDAWDKESARPDFMVLLYPVITFTRDSMHSGSRDALIGSNPSAELARQYSSELQVREDTPPTILIHASDDEAVPVENSLLFYKALNENGVPASLHIYPSGGHGFSLGLRDPYLHSWTDQVIRWMNTIP